MYRCPEFERVSMGTPGRNYSPKSQNVFNYTRTVMGRKLLSSYPGIGDADAGDELWPGPIMKLSSVYSPAGLFMMLDEQWDFHCAGNYNDGGSENIRGYWMAADTIHGLIGDQIASYHGTKSNALGVTETLASAKGSIGYYDGHVELYQDPLPYRWASSGLLAMVMSYSDGVAKAIKALDPVVTSIFAQRGLSTDQVIQVLIGSL
jgi:hypothetical protein